MINTSDVSLQEIDGSFGEGGGQIVRSTVTLSCITKKPIRIYNIRKNRKNPGLRPQHLVGIELLAEICKAKVEGLRVGSTSIQFFPSEVQNAKISKNIGTAGSISLLLQTLIPAVSISKKSLELSIKGGTDVPWSPTCNYTKFVLAEAYNRMGIKLRMEIKKRGYYPKGGGEVFVKVQPAEKLKPIFLTQRKTSVANLLCSYSKISGEKIVTEIEKIKEYLKKMKFSVDSKIVEEPALNVGGSLLIYSKDEGSIVGSDGLYENNIGTFKHKIAQIFVENCLGVDVNLSDMLVIPASLIRDESVYQVTKISNHLKTNLEITSKFLGSKYQITKLDSGYKIKLKSSSS